MITHHPFTVFVDCKKGYRAVLNSTELLECVACAVDTYQEADSRNTNCTNCPTGANTMGDTGSIECRMFFVFDAVEGMVHICNKNYLFVS